MCELRHIAYAELDRHHIRDIRHRRRRDAHPRRQRGWNIRRQSRGASIAENQNIARIMAELLQRHQRERERLENFLLAIGDYINQRMERRESLDHPMVVNDRPCLAVTAIPAIEQYTKRQGQMPDADAEFRYEDDTVDNVPRAGEPLTVADLVQKFARCFVDRIEFFPGSRDLPAERDGSIGFGAQVHAIRYQRNQIVGLSVAFNPQQRAGRSGEADVTGPVQAIETPPFRPDAAHQPGDAVPGHQTGIPLDAWSSRMPQTIGGGVVGDQRAVDAA